MATLTAVSAAGAESTASYRDESRDGVSAAHEGGNDCGRQQEQQEVQRNNNDRTSHLSCTSSSPPSPSSHNNIQSHHSHMHHPNAVGGDSAPITLDFADVDHEIVKLGPFTQNRLQNATLNANPQPKPQISITPTTTTPNGTPKGHTPASTVSNASSKSSAALNPRKPSPGLAARLKALGFGGSKRGSSLSPSSHPDSIGRLPEDQLRELDQKHIAASGTLTVEKRGRPWKGPGPLSLISKPSLQSLRRRPTTSSSDDTKSEPSPNGTKGELSPNDINRSFADYSVSIASSGTSPVSQSASIQLLPEINTPPPLDMETNKYRLPDFTNGNGTKVQLATRQEHLDRDARPLSPDDPPPPPLPKDSPLPLADNPIDPFSFNPLGLQRPGSIYTLSRASFANQLAQLTSLQLPDATSLSGKVSAIPTAEAAAKALILAAEQIRSWIHKASEVIDGLDSDDDVEWAAAGGREGLAEVEHAIGRFEDLIKVYISAIEQLQSRPDIGNVHPEDNQRAVAQMEIIVAEWEKIHVTLQSVKIQVEIAMEWEELWDQVLGDIQSEMDELCRLVFEMEERRHRVASGEGVDINDLETIVEENAPPSQPVRLQAGSRFSLPTFPLSPSSPHQTFSQDDSSLLALFARMQPLRASLDFLPMRLAGFMSRAETTFPNACEELEMRKSSLEASYKKLEKDAESLRKELGEDRWLIVFRGAGRQAQKMYESVERSVLKLKEAVDAGMHLTNQPAMLKKIESFDAKKTHYSPAIERILAMIEKGVRDRLTVNGEIMRLHMETRTKWEALKRQMREMDASLEEIQAEQKRGQQLRDSISSMLSNDRSTIGSGNETPGSSPPSSVIMSTLGLDPKTPVAKKARASSLGSSHLPQARRYASMATPPNAASQLPRKPGSRLSALAYTPPRSDIDSPAKSTPRHDNRPRWNGSTNTSGLGVGHNFTPLTLTSPSPYAKSSNPNSPSTVTPESRSKLPTLKSPTMSRAGSMSPGHLRSPTPARNVSRLSFRDRVASTGPYSQQRTAASSAPKPQPRLQAANSMSVLANNRRASMQPPKLGTSTSQPSRSASSMASSRRVSMLPQPKGSNGGVSGRESPQAIAGARVAMQKSASTTDKHIPRWRF